MKSIIYICICIGSLIGGAIGMLIDHGNALGIWGLLLGAVGAFLGIWIGYSINKNYY